MDKLIFSLKQGLRNFVLDRRKFYLIALEIGIAIALCNLLLTISYSIQQTEQAFHDSLINTSVKIYGREKEFNTKKVPFTSQDLADLQVLLAGKGNPVLFADRIASSRHQMVDGAFARLNIRFTNMIPVGQYYATELAEEFLADGQFSGSSGYLAYREIKQQIQDGTLKKITLSEELLDQCQLESYRVEVDSERLLLLPLELYIQFDRPLESDQYMLAIFFPEKYDAEGVIQTARLLQKRHGEDYDYHYVSTYREFRRKVSQIDYLAKGILVMVLGALIVIILGLGGVETAIVKKQMKDISIRLCLGVPKSLIYLETLLNVLIPSLLGGSLGLLGSSLIIDKINFQTFTLQRNFWIGVLSLTIACLVGILAGILPLIFKLHKIRPLRILKEEN